MTNIKSDFQLLLALSSYHVDQISSRVIEQLESVNEDNFLLSGDDSGLKNTWEEICVQAQGEGSFHWNVYEEVIGNFIVSELEKQPAAIQILLSYVGSIDSEFEYREDEDPYVIFQEAAIKEVTDHIMMTAGYYENENISRYLDGDFSDDEEEE